MVLYLVVCGSFFFYRFRRHLGFWSWCLGIRVLGICNVVSSFWKRHFAIEADRETIEEIQFIQVHIQHFGECHGLIVEMMLTNTMGFGTGNPTCCFIGFHWCGLVW